MVKEKSVKEFLKAKELVIENLETLQFRISNYEDQGMIDEGSTLYNEAISIIDQTELCHSFAELDEMIIKGKEVEHNIDTWVSLHGGSTYELTWPVITPFLE